MEPWRAPPPPLWGAFQPMYKKLYADMGTDTSGDTFNIHAGLVQILSGAVEPPPEFQPLYQKLYAKMGTDATTHFQAEASQATHTWNAAP